MYESGGNILNVNAFSIKEKKAMIKRNVSGIKYEIADKIFPQIFITLLNIELNNSAFPFVQQGLNHTF